MFINEHTKISDIINYNPSAIDEIVKLSKHFEKLRIPILRKTLAKRVSIKQASLIGGIKIERFYEVLLPLGYTSDLNSSTSISTSDTKPMNVPSVTNSKNKHVLDVRDLLKNNKDPFNLIMRELKSLPDEHTLILINSFEPVPLIDMLTKKGYDCQSIQINEFIYHTYINKRKTSLIVEELPFKETYSKMNEILIKFQLSTKEIDVRHLEMPLPLTTILHELSSLPDDHLLYIHHKKIPQFLLPQLAELDYKWVIHETEAREIKLLIFKE